MNRNPKMKLDLESKQTNLLSHFQKVRKNDPQAHW